MPDNDNHTPTVRWIRNREHKGELQFTFDGVQIFNLFHDYPYALSDEQKRVFDEENPFLGKLFCKRVIHKIHPGIR